MSALPGSPPRHRRSHDPDPGPDPGHSRRDSFSFGVLAAGGPANPPTPEPLLPEQFSRSQIHRPYAAYGIPTAMGSSPAPAVEVASDPEGRFVWTLAGSSRQQLLRAGGNPAARLTGGDRPPARAGGGGAAPSVV